MFRPIALNTLQISSGFGLAVPAADNPFALRIKGKVITLTAASRPHYHTGGRPATDWIDRSPGGWSSGYSENNNNNEKIRGPEFLRRSWKAWGTPLPSTHPGRARILLDRVPQQQPQHLDGVTSPHDLALLKKGRGPDLPPPIQKTKLEVIFPGRPETF